MVQLHQMLAVISIFVSLIRTLWDCGFESLWRNEYLSLVSVVCCQVEVYTSGWSLVQRSPTECVSVIVNPR